MPDSVPARFAATTGEEHSHPHERMTDRRHLVDDPAVGGVSLVIVRGSFGG
jgi:hypothetical protein